MLLASTAMAQRVEVSPQTMTLRVGETAQASLSVFDSAGAPIQKSFEWLPSEGMPTTCAQVSPTGLVTAIKPGTCAISAVVLLSPATGAVPKTPLTITVLPGPTLLNDTSGRAIALHSTQFTAEPFSLISPLSFSEDKRTRVLLFLTDVDEASIVGAVLTDSRGVSFNLSVEGINKLPALDVWYVTVVLPGDASSGDASVVLNVRGLSTNAGKIALQ
jgi:hypothetical protein